MPHSPALAISSAVAGLAFALGGAGLVAWRLPDRKAAAPTRVAAVTEPIRVVPVAPKIDDAQVRVASPTPYGSLSTATAPITPGSPKDDTLPPAVSGATPAPAASAPTTPVAPPRAVAFAAPAPQRVPVSDDDDASVTPKNPRRSDPTPGSGRLVNLNSASVDALNGLPGGHVGRAIIRGRPYRDPEDLVRRRILTKGSFARIRAFVTVR